MGFDFTRKAIVVTGGASGLGRAFCAELARRGARVGVADIERDKAEAVAAEIGGGALAFAVDTSSEASVEALAGAAWEAFGRVDGVFNNAGVNAGKPLLKASTDDFDWIMGVNLKGVFLGSREFGQRFVAQGGPALIVNTGSEHSLGVPHLGAGLYTASKHAVHGLTDVLRRELPEEIQVSLFCPGIVETEFWNAQRNRPDALGGPKTAHEIGREIMSHGMEPADVAGRALDAIESGAFYIVTHPHNLEMIRAREAELEAAFETQTADVDGAAYDVNDILARVLPDRD